MRSVFTCSSLIITTAFAAGNPTPSEAAAIPAPAVSLKINVILGRPVIDGVYLNGKGPFRFLIDTGAQTNQVEARIARELGLAPTFRVEIATAAASAMTAGARISLVRLGSVTAADQEFLFTGLDGVHALSGGVQGVIGQEFLSRFNYLLDFRGRRIVLGAPEPGGGIRTDLNIVDGRPAVATERGKLVIDSGIETALFFTASEESGGRVLTAAGDAFVSAMKTFTFRIGGRLYTTAGASAGRGNLREDGIVPASLFQAVYVNNADKYIVIDPVAGVCR